MKYYIFLLTVLLLGCKQQTKKETMYFLYRGDRIYSFPDLVLKNSDGSFVDSIMPVGKPLEYQITVETFAKLKYVLTKQNQFDENKNQYDKGIMIILYDDNMKTGSYLFKEENEIDKLVSIFEMFLSGETKSQAIGWIEGICKIHKIPTKRCNFLKQV